MDNEHNNNRIEKRCEDVRESALARLDNEVDEAACAHIEKHLLSCAPCAEYIENATILLARLCEELSDDMDIAPLWSRISTALDTEVRVEPAHRITSGKGGAGRRMFAYGAIAAAMLVAIFTYSSINVSKIHAAPLTVTESINDFLTFRASGRKLDVNSSEPLKLRQWFVKRLDFEVPLSSAMPAGFQLDGARLCSFLNRRLASFMYHMGGKAASLYIMTETGLEATLKQVPRHHELMVFSLRGLTNVVWRSDGLLYVVVADFPETQALEFAKSVGDPANVIAMKVTYLQHRNPEHGNGIQSGLQRFSQLLFSANSQALPPGE